MNINNYECDGQMSIEDFLVSNNQEVKRLLHSGEVVFEAIKGDVERHVVTDEHWYIEHLKTYGNRTRVTIKLTINTATNINILSYYADHKFNSGHPNLAAKRVTAIYGVPTYS